MEKKKWNKVRLWSGLNLGQKLVLEVALTAAVLFGCNLFIYWQVNQTFIRMDSVYGSNVSLTELSEAFEEVNDSTYEYLTVKSSDALERYYRGEAQFREFLEKLNDKNIDNPIKILEKNIRAMSEKYLKLTNDAVQAKRGRNVEKYKALYNEAQKMYEYINYNIYDLNSQQFKSNANTYEKLQNAMKYMEIASSAILIVVMVVGIAILMLMTKDIVAPLRDLADTANLVGQGNFHVKVPPSRSEDEIGIVTGAFNTMVDSLEDYMRRTREGMEKEQKMKERELLMEAHLKEAQLKFFQSQINPHFLFNSLNAGAQLAMLEDAERTCLFMEKMADFFRYNVKKTSEDAMLGEEIEAVDNYIYILNVRFSGDIEYRSEVDEAARNFRVPSMILQPLVENAVNHGIRNVEWKGHVHLKVMKKPHEIRITIKDNGKGMTRERIEEVLKGKKTTEEIEKDATGVGIYNVKSRLELYYGKENLLRIYSEGEDRGTEIILALPVREEKEHVQNIAG